MPTETELQDAVQQDQQTSTGPETHQTQAQPQSGQQSPLNTPPQTTPATGATGAASSTLGGTAMGSGSTSQTLPGGSNATTGGTSMGTSGTSSPSSGMTRRRSASPASLLGDPFGMVRSFMDQMDRIFDDFTGLGRSRRPDLPSARSFSGLGQGSQGQSMGFWYPQVEVSEKGGNLVVCADLPGLKKEDVRLEIHDDYLVLEGERHSEREENQEGLYRTERSYGRFYRTIPLPEGTDPDQVRASFKDGVLEVTVPMPNRGEQQRGRRIEIQ
ncbi:MAG TPA: Hsp20/alpha crystallin family protein [Thermoanaerobaculia bacterium]